MGDVPLSVQNPRLLHRFRVLQLRLGFAARFRNFVVLVFRRVVDLRILLLAGVRNRTERFLYLAARRLDILELDVDDLDAGVIFVLQLQKLLPNLVLNFRFSVRNRVIELLRADDGTNGGACRIAQKLLRIADIVQIIADVADFPLDDGVRGYDVLVPGNHHRLFFYRRRNVAVYAIADMNALRQLGGHNDDLLDRIRPFEMEPRRRFPRIFAKSQYGGSLLLLYRVEAGRSDHHCD